MATCELYSFKLDGGGVVVVVVFCMCVCDVMLRCAFCVVALRSVLMMVTRVRSCVYVVCAPSVCGVVIMQELLW